MAVTEKAEFWQQKNTLDRQEEENKEEEEEQEEEKEQEEERAMACQGAKASQLFGKTSTSTAAECAVIEKKKVREKRTTS